MGYRYSVTPTWLGGVYRQVFPHEFHSRYTQGRYIDNSSEQPTKLETQSSHPQHRKTHNRTEQVKTKPTTRRNPNAGIQYGISKPSTLAAYTVNNPTLPANEMQALSTRPASPSNNFVKPKKTKIRWVVSSLDAIYTDLIPPKTGNELHSIDQLYLHM